MSFSYSGDPSSSVLDAIRFEIQDTNAAAPLLDDGEIKYAIREGAPSTPLSQGEVFAAAARCCEALARRFAAQADTQFGSIKTTYSKQAEVYAERAIELRKRAQGSHAPFAGGLSVSEKESRESETDRVASRFKIGQFQRGNSSSEDGWPSGW